MIMIKGDICDFMCAYVCVRVARPVCRRDPDWDTVSHLKLDVMFCLAEISGDKKIKSGACQGHISSQRMIFTRTHTCIGVHTCALPVVVP